MTIYQIQCLLAYLGYTPGAIDGISGQQTQAAVEEFQRQAGLDVDGVAGTATQEALIQAVADGNFEAASSSEANVSENTTGSAAGDFWAGIRYFIRSEFACKCGKYCDGYPAEPAEALVTVAERVREHFGQPVIISSGLRCTQHNANVGGVANSRHLTGHAMDYMVTGHTAAEVLAYAQGQPEIVYAYAINSSYVHMDIGP